MLVVIVVCCVGICLVFVVNIWFMIMYLIKDVGMLVFFRVFLMVMVFSLLVLKFFREFINLLMGVCVLVIIIDVVMIIFLVYLKVDLIDLEK